MAAGPADIQPKIERIIEEIIGVDMRHHGFLPYGEGWMDTSATSLTDPDNPVTPGWIPGPGGAPTGVVLVNPQFVHLAGRDIFNPTVDVYEHWAARIPEMFADFLAAPLEDDYSTLLDFLTSGTETLSLSVVPNDGDEIGLKYVANDALVAALHAGDGELAQLNGQAMNAFVLHWWGKLGPIFDRYSLVARMLFILTRAEARIWHHYWNDLDRVCDGIIGGLEPGGHPPDIPFEAIGTITEVLSWLPVVGNIAGKINDFNSKLSTLSDLAGLFGHEKTTRGYDFYGNASHCEGEIKKILDDLSEDVRDQESGLRVQANAVEELMFEPGWDLGDPNWVLDADERSDILSDGNLISLDWATIKHIADDVLGIVRQSLVDAQGWNRVSIARFAFTREGLVGRASLGPYNSYDNVCTRLNYLCQKADMNLADVSEVLKTVGQIFRTEDEQQAEDYRVKQRLAGLDH